MIIRPQDKINILISGFFVTVALGIIAVSIFMLSSENNLLSRTISLHIEAQSAQNLKNGAEVQLRGIKIGSVSAIEVDTLEKLKITMKVNSSYRNWIRQDSYVSFRTHGVLGDRFLEIHGGTEESERVLDGEKLNVKDDSVLDKFITQGEDILTVATRVLQRVDHILESVENNRVQNILVSLEETTKATENLIKAIETQDLGSLIKNLNETTTAMNNTVSTVDRISKQVEQGPGSLNSLIYDRSLHDDLKTILGGTKRNKVLQYFIRESIRKAD
jgi:phospholipid/cholesterol/gamma-HCH transport system substrate-binding protein